MAKQFDVIIIGAGAAGFMCAIEAGKRGRRVLLLEKSKTPGDKIRISGGGRCNFTNLHTSPANYLSQNPHFCVSALRRYTQHDFIALVEKHGIAYHEKTLGQLFCDGSSRQIIQMLVHECDAANVVMQLGTMVSGVSKLKQGFQVMTDGQEYTCASLVIATGGPSIPKMGATGWGYEIAQQFGLSLVTPCPALVPFTLSDEHLSRLKPLAGISLEVIASTGKQSFREGMLFTHRGLSGPAILQISSYWKEGEAVTLNLLPDVLLFEELKKARQTHPRQEIVTLLAQYLPKKLGQYIGGSLAVKGRLADHSNKAINQIHEAIHNWKIFPNGTEGYRTAEVTLGGVDTNQLSSKTFEAKAVPGLFFIGEVLDVTGHLGGFNFQWAWSSGHAAGQYV